MWLVETVESPASPSIHEICTLRKPERFIISKYHFEFQTATGVWTRHDYVFGDLESAAIFCLNHPNSSAQGPAAPLDSSYYDGGVSGEDLLYCLDQGLFHPTNLFQTIENQLDSAEPVLRTPSALSHISDIYKLLPDATISVDTLSQPLHQSKWVRSIYGPPGQYGSVRQAHVESLNREQVFSCLAYLKTGSIDIDPEQLLDVFAMSASDSIYVPMPVGHLLSIETAQLILISEQLLCDPWDVPSNFEMTRILGNIGRAGISMLILPQELMTRAPNPASWKNIGVENFNGRQEDTFKQTILHLSFTGYNHPIFEGIGGARDNQASFVGSVISAYDRGVWVGDLDILRSLEKIERLKSQCYCEDRRLAPISARALLSLESWDEILDPPNASSVIRASGNWPARLAIIATLVQNRGNDESLPFRPTALIIVCPRSTCWECALPNVEQLKSHPFYQGHPGSLKYFVY